MRKITVLLSVMLLVLAMTGTAALADSEWGGTGDYDVLDSDSSEVHVVEPELNVNIDIDGDEVLATGEAGEYTVTVKNDGETGLEGTSIDDETLSDWKLGLEVSEFDDPSNFDLAFCKDGFDQECILLVDGGEAVEGTGVDVAIDHGNGIIWILGDEEDDLAPQETEVQKYEATFHEGGNFTGTAYILQSSE